MLSCNKETEYETITVDDKYSIELPKYLRKTNNLNDDATLQYMNVFKELYVVVIDEPIELFHSSIIDNNLQDKYSEGFEGYNEILIDSFIENTDACEIISRTDTIINNTPAIVYKANTTSENTDIYFHFAYLKGKGNYYQVFTWTLAEKEEDHKEILQKMLYSFKDL